MILYLYKKNLIKNFNIEKFGYICFLTGIFFLASAVGISILLLLISVIISFQKPHDFIKDKWNYPLLFCGILMLISTCIHFGRYEQYVDLGIDPKLSLIGLFNWLPFFFCFWGFQNYLNSPKKRLITTRLLISGSIPVIFSGILQLLNINGPFELFYGLVVWFQKPINDIGSLAGLFNNQNYAGLWMVLVWPFCLSELYSPHKINLKKLTLLIISILFVCFIFLTDSRNAILSLIISSPIILGTSNLVWYLPAIFLGFSLLGLTILPIIPNEIKLFMESIIPSRIYTLFPEIGLNNINSYPRINKWITSLSLIFQNPIFGWGAASFPILYSLNGERFGHAHNLPIEFAISYGVLPSLIIFTFYGSILYLSLKKISQLFKTNRLEISYFLNSKAWFAASLIFLLSHQFDIQYFDVRISTLCWLFLSGLRCLLREKTKIDNKL
tara:strand:- start:7 stop:1329 length:1323 start_codon:yes stop_codon:yes gene_type:complete